jgi:hypothetical protein
MPYHDRKCQITRRTRWFFCSIMRKSRRRPKCGKERRGRVVRRRSELAERGVDLTWNAGGFQGKMAEGRPDDVAFIGKLLDDLGEVVKVDTKRVYACGMSNGGMMCCRLAARRFAVRGRRRRGGQSGACGCCGSRFRVRRDADPSVRSHSVRPAVSGAAAARPGRFGRGLASKERPLSAVLGVLFDFEAFAGRDHAIVVQIVT